MAAPSLARTSFPEHPYTPYPIQQRFMEALYTTLDEGSIGLFESPTGTGKTISIICGALHWLEDSRQRSVEDALAVDDDSGDPDWLRAAHQQGAAKPPPEPHPWLKRRASAGPRGPRVVQPHAFGAPQSSSRRTGGIGSGTTGQASGKGELAGGAYGSHKEEDEEFLLASVAADVSAGGDDGLVQRARLARIRARKLLEDSSGGSSGEEGGKGEEDIRRAALRALRAPPAPPARKPQIFFASRTHSQLAQFVQELRKTGFSSRLRLVSLASRRGLCVHEPVAALGNAGLITERCTELQERTKSGGTKARKTGGCGGGGGAAEGGCGGARAARGRRSGAKGGGGGCPFLAPSLEASEGFAEAVLGEALDVEDLGREGRRRGLCPYYGSRALLPEADVVALPYSALLSEETRGSLGLQLEGSIVIFDEAHNLVDAVTGAHGAQVTLEQLRTASRQLSAYFSRFQMRLSATNVRNVQLLIRLAASLERTLAPPPQPALPPQPPPRLQRDPMQRAGAAGAGAEPGASAPDRATAGCSGNSSSATGGVEVHGCYEFLTATRLDHLNLFPLLAWVRESRLVMKVAGYDLTATAAAAGRDPAATAEAMLDLYDDDGEGAAGTAAAGASVALNRRKNGAVGDAAGAAATGDGGGSGFGARRSALFAFIAFLTALTYPNAEGRIIVTRAAAAAAADGGVGTASTDEDTGAAATASLRYTLLSAASQFAAVLRAARSVILASGTLSPIEGLTAQLLPGATSRVRHFSCDHVVPPENLLALVAARGPTGVPLDLRHGRRNDPRVCDEVGRLLVNVCTAVPAGVVVFAPSFAYLDLLVGAWQRSTVWGSLTARKAVFVEPRTAGQVEAVLEAYAGAVRRAVAAGAAGGGAGAGASGGGGRQASGAVLLSVVGGKLSEGINFGDDLGRCVVVLGMPYPNPSDPELQERMRFLDEVAAKSTHASITTHTNALPPTAPAAASAAVTQGQAFTSPSGSPPTAAAATVPPLGTPRLTGRQYYEGLCIKAVNQCVGRVIRHAQDYAAIVLVDQRYLPAPPPTPPSAAAAPGAKAAPAGLSAAGVPAATTAGAGTRRSGGGDGGSGGASGGGSSRGAGNGGNTGGSVVVRSLPVWIRQSLKPGSGDFAHLYSNLVAFFRGRGVRPC